MLSSRSIEALGAQNPKDSPSALEDPKRTQTQGVDPEEEGPWA